MYDTTSLPAFRWGRRSGTPKLRTLASSAGQLATAQVSWTPLKAECTVTNISCILMCLVQLMMHSPGASFPGKVLLTGE